MPINTDAVGSQGDPFISSWDSKDCLLYAVGIGAGAADLPFSTENSRDKDGNMADVSMDEDSFQDMVSIL